MFIHTFWAWREGESTPELLVAWDDFTFDGWPEGYEEAIDKASVGLKSSEPTRRIELAVENGRIEACFEPEVVRAVVSEER